MSNIRIFFSQFSISTSASASYNLCWASFSPLTANSALRSRILWRICQPLKKSTTFRSRSLFSLHTQPTRLATSAQVSLMQVRPTTESRSANTLRLVPNAPSFQRSGNPACCRMLAASWSSRMSRQIEAISSGDRRAVLLRETHVSGR